MLKRFWKIVNRGELAHQKEAASDVVRSSPETIMESQGSPKSYPLCLEISIQLGIQVRKKILVPQSLDNSIVCKAEMFANGMWRLWQFLIPTCNACSAPTFYPFGINTRHILIFEGITESPKEVDELAERRFEEFSKSLLVGESEVTTTPLGSSSLEFWKVPPTHLIKLNIDIVLINKDIVGVCIVARYLMGDILMIVVT
ncbi:hypothetical protein PIB30_037554 [Stylosanthes scabra]|uniref:Uncharacterized protein n=1 Tax=Stylosanthes scabra TaxID=79078 RepID=A0ABU6SE90_9FABA|nr:hypothetical protein [Stylosanthes scabra]